MLESGIATVRSAEVNDDLTYYQATDPEIEESFLSFLNEVAGIDTQRYDITSFIVNSNRFLGSDKTEIAISAVLVNKQNNQNISIAMVLIEGKVKFYDLGLLSGTLDGSELGIDDCLARTKRAISNYRAEFNGSFSTEVISIIPDSVSSSNTYLRGKNFSINIHVNDQAKTQLKYMTVLWQRSIDGITIKQLSIQSTMSKTGILTYFSDNIGLYEMAATNVSITKEAALEIAMPYIEEYATANGRKIEATNATLNYVRDLNGSRGDSTLIYPQWCVSALFDSSTKEVYGFDVFVWADTGLVDSAHAQGNYRQPDDLANLVYSLIWATVIISVIATILCVGKKWFVSKGIIPKLMIV